MDEVKATGGVRPVCSMYAVTEHIKFYIQALAADAVPV